MPLVFLSITQKRQGKISTVSERQLEESKVRKRTGAGIISCASCTGTKSVDCLLWQKLFGQFAFATRKVRFLPLHGVFFLQMQTEAQTDVSILDKRLCRNTFSNIMRDREPCMLNGDCFQLSILMKLTNSEQHWKQTTLATELTDKTKPEQV